MIKTDQDQFSLVLGERDYWPFVRILLVSGILAGLNVDAHSLIRLPARLIGVLAVLAMLSFAAAELYLFVLATPLYVIGVLNDCFYKISRWVCMSGFGMRSSPALAVGGLLGELFLSGGLVLAVRRLLSVP